MTGQANENRQFNPIAVIGAGMMGHGIAYALAAAGHPVGVFDQDPRAMASLPPRLGELQTLLGHDEAALGRITPCSSLAQAAKDAGFVVEATTENLQIKQYVIAELESVVSPETIIASGTSALSVTKVAENALYPNRIIGTHFWNPPHLVRLVEVVQAEQTSAETVTKTMALMAAAGHHPVHVQKDVPGFIGTRLQHALIREAIALVAEGVCDAKTVDDAVKYGFGPSLSVVGPLEQSDLEGLEITRSAQQSLLRHLDRTTRPNRLVDTLISEGRLGAQTGAGFRSWTETEAAELRLKLTEALARNIRA